MSNELALPERPNLDQLRKQARERQRSNPGQSLFEAQLELARAYGFASWTRLKHHVEEMLGLRTYLEAFFEATQGGRLDEADAILAAHPELRSTSTVALLTGDADTVEGVEPNEPLGPRLWVPLLYVCFSRYYQRPEARTGLIAIATDLLRRGADPDASYLEPDFPEHPETCLYGAVGINNNTELTRLLLQYGANAQDVEALYHGTEHADHNPLRLVFEAGGSPKGANCVAHMLDRDDVSGLELVLEHYGPPDDELSNALHHAIIRGRSVEHLRRLVEHGADPAFRRNNVTAYVRARMMLRTEAAEFLESIGADTSVTPAERFVIACAEGDASVPATTVPAELQWTLSDAASHGLIDAMRRMLEAGFDPSVASGWGQTGLHQAGWRGLKEPVELLLQYGASLAVRDPHHHGTPLNFTIAGAAWGINPAGDHLGAARAMLEAGAAEHCDPDFVWNLTKDLPRLRALLEEFKVNPTRSQT